MLKREIHTFFKVFAPIWFISASQGQQLPIPAINDPFPQNPGPEPQPTTLAPFRGCPAECNVRLDEAMRIISKMKPADLEIKIRDLNITVISRLNNNIPASPGQGGGPSSTLELTMRVSNLEMYLPGNITTVTDKLTNDLTTTSGTLTTEISDVRQYIDNRINQLQGNAPTAGNGQTDATYNNITARLDLLEYDKVQTLIDENNVWRKNFEVVNKTFSKMKKSSYSNEVIVVG